MEEQMLLSILRSLTSILILCFATSAMANDAFIYYKNSGDTATTSQYNNLKSQLEDAGFTVTSSTSGTVSSSDVSGQDLVIDITGSSNCGSTCKSVYDSYVSGGGKLVIAGANGADNRNNSIEALIETTMGVGSFTQGGGCQNCYGSVAKGDYASSTASENVLPGPDKYMTGVTGGTTVAAMSAANNNIPTIHKWDYGTNGGAVYVTFGYGQFLSTHTYASNMDALILEILEEEGLYSAAPPPAPTPVYGPSGPTVAQQSRMNAKAALAAQGQGNTVEATITGDDNDINITQAGGPSYTLLSILGNTNAFDSEQDLATGSHGYIESTIIGDSNDVDIIQKGIGDKATILTITGDSNDVDIEQLGLGDKFIDLEITGDDHTASIFQNGAGNHSARVELDGTQPWNFDLTQKGATDQSYTLPHSMSDGSSVSGTCMAIGGCNLTILQE